MKPLWLTRTLPALPSPMEEELAERGWELVALPVLEIAYHDLAADEVAALRQAWANADAIIACSAHAVLAAARWCQAPRPATRLYAVGGRTARQFSLQFGGTVRTPPGGHGGQALIDSHARLAAAGQRVLILGGEDGRGDWQNELRVAGAQVQEFTLYRRHAHRCSLPNSPPTAVIATSGAALRALTALVADQSAVMTATLLLPREGLLPIARSLSWSGRIAATKTFSAAAVEEALNRRD